MIFWTGWSKFLFPKRSVRKHWAFRFWLVSQKNLKSKDVFDITGRVFSETAVNNIFLLPLSRGNVTRLMKINIFMLGFIGICPFSVLCFFFSMSLWFNFFDVDYLVLVFALSRNDVCFSWKCIRQTRPLFLFSSFKPRPQGFSLNKWVGREKALASAGHLSFISLYKGSFTNITARCPLYRNRRKAKDHQSQYLWQKGNLVKLFVNRQEI